MTGNGSLPATAHDVQPGNGLFSVAGKQVAILGGTRGIGAEVAIGLYRLGASVMICGSTAESVAAMNERLAALPAVRGADAACRQVDVADPEAVEGFVSEAAANRDALDLVMNCAAIAPHRPALEVTAAQWRAVMAIDLDGVFYGCVAAARAMIPRGGGSIINVSSVSGVLGYAGQAAYCAAKGGVNMLTRALAVEWAERGVRVNAIAPTWFYSSLSASVLSDPRQAQQKLASIPQGRFGTAGEDLLGPVAFLCSDASRYITGHVLMVDGGKFALLGET